MRRAARRLQISGIMVVRLSYQRCRSAEQASRVPSYGPRFVLAWIGALMRCALLSLNVGIDLDRVVSFPSAGHIGSVAGGRRFGLSLHCQSAGENATCG